MLAQRPRQCPSGQRGDRTGASGTGEEPPSAAHVFPHCLWPSRACPLLTLTSRHSQWRRDPQAAPGWPGKRVRAPRRAALYWSPLRCARWSRCSLVSEGLRWGVQGWGQPRPLLEASAPFPCFILKPLYSNPCSPSVLDASWLPVYEEEEEAVNFIEAFVKNPEKRVRAALSMAAVPACPGRAPALLPGCCRAAGWAELLPSRRPAQLRTPQCCGPAGCGSPSCSLLVSLWLPG